MPHLIKYEGDFAPNKVPLEIIEFGHNQQTIVHFKREEGKPYDGPHEEWLSKLPPHKLREHAPHFLKMPEGGNK
jgi:hypothetical protein